MKRQIVLGILSLLFLALVSFIIVFNFAMTNFIEHEAKKALQEEIIFFQTATDEDIDIEETRSMQVNTLFLEEDMLSFPYYTEREKRLIQYMQQQPLLDDDIISTTIHGEKFYLAQITVAQDLIPTSENIVLYVNVSALTTLAKTLNIIFLAVLIIFTALAILVGIYLGKKIENAEEKTQQFFQNISHELQTPIMAIQGYAEGIETDILPNHQQAAQVIMKESQNMSELIEELLFLAKLNSGQLHLNQERVDVNELVFDVLRSLEWLTKKNNIHIRMNPATKSPVIIGDEKQLYKALSNLLRNALTYAYHQIFIDIQTSIQHVQIIVSDDGDGIAAKDLPHIFERFYKGAKGNMGIGLALTKEIVELHNGELLAKNTKSGGASFTMILPAS